MSKPAPRPLTARRGPLSNSTLPAPTLSAAAGQAARRRIGQPDPSPALCLWHLGRVPRRSGEFELLRSRRQPRNPRFRRSRRRSRGQRIPQVRYTYSGPYGSALSVSAETPETDIMTPAGKVHRFEFSNHLGGSLAPTPRTVGSLLCRQWRRHHRHHRLYPVEQHHQSLGAGCHLCVLLVAALGPCRCPRRHPSDPDDQRRQIC